METDHLLSDGATRSLGILLIDWPTLGHVTTPDSVSVVGGSGLGLGRIKCLLIDVSRLVLYSHMISQNGSSPKIRQVGWARKRAVDGYYIA